MGLNVKRNKSATADIFPYVTMVVVKLFGTQQRLEVPITEAAKKKASKVSDGWFVLEGPESICWINNDDDYSGAALYKDRVAALVTRGIWESGGPEYIVGPDVGHEQVFIQTNKLLGQSWFRLKELYLNILKLDIIPNYTRSADSIVEVAYRTGGGHQIKVTASILGRIRHLVKCETDNKAERIKVTLTAKPFGEVDIQHHAYYDADKPSER